MGEATYYAKVYFESNDKAVSSLPKVQAFLMECVNASEWLAQNHIPTDTKPFDLEGFAKIYPLANEFIRFVEEEKGRSGATRIGPLEDVGDLHEIDSMGVAERCIYYCATVWHFADWDPLMDFIVQKFGAVNGSWLSDEYMDPFDLL